MTWLRVASPLIRRDGPTLLYWEIGPRESGNFRLWLDVHGQVQSFQLTYAGTTGQPEYSAEWDHGRRLYLGIVDAGEHDLTGRHHIKMSPIIRRVRHPDRRSQLTGELFNTQGAYVNQAALRAGPICRC